MDSSDLDSSSNNGNANISPPNGLTIGSVGFAQHTRVSNTQTLKHTDHATCDIRSNKPYLCTACIRCDLCIPPPLPGIESVKQATLLGIDVTDTLSTAAYVDRLLMQVNQRLYLSSLLQSSGLQRSSLHLLFNALVINKLTYALPAYAGQLTYLIFAVSYVWYITRPLHLSVKLMISFCY